MVSNNRGISDISESQIRNPSDLFDKGERGGFFGKIENEHEKNVAKLRQYQREKQWDIVEDPSYDSNTTSQSNVYVIDDADEALRASMGRSSNVFRPSLSSRISDISRGSEFSRDDKESLFQVPQEKRNYVGSKESIMLMQDIDVLSGHSENAEYIIESSDQHRSPHSTLIPEVFNHSPSDSLSHGSTRVTPPPIASSLFNPQRLSPMTNRKPQEEGKTRTALPPHFTSK